MKVASDFARPALSSIYEVAGRFLLVDASDEQTAATLQDFLGRWHMPLVSGDRRPEANSKIIIRSGTAPDVPSGYEEFSLVDDAIGYASDTAYQIVFGDESVMSADESATVSLWLQGPLHRQTDLLAQIVSHSVSAALRRCGIFELHSGAAISLKHGKSILICGPSGTGKSTLTLQLAATGWNYLSDDVMLLSAERDKVRATGLRRFFALTRETAAGSGLPEVNQLLSKGYPNDFAKQRLEPAGLFPAAEECWPDLIYFPKITGKAASQMRELSPAETMSRLIRLCPWSCYDRAVARQFLDALAKLVKQSVSFDLFAGNDLMGDPNFTSEYLASPFKERAL